MNGCMVQTIDRVAGCERTIPLKTYHVRLVTGNDPNVIERLQKELCAKNQHGGSFVPAVDVDIKTKCEKSEMGAGLIVNNLISIFTLVLWPGGGPEYRITHTVSVAIDGKCESRVVTIDRGSWISLLPWAYVPAIFSDEFILADNSPEGRGESDARYREFACECITSSIEDMVYSGSEKHRHVAMRLKNEDCIRDFILSEAPEIWNAVQHLRGCIADGESRLTALRNDYRLFGRDPKRDQEFLQIEKQYDELSNRLNALYAKMEDAYLAMLKFKATPRRSDYLELKRRTLEDGLVEAAAAEMRYREMMITK